MLNEMDTLRFLSRLTGLEQSSMILFIRILIPSTPSILLSKIINSSPPHLAIVSESITDFFNLFEI